MPATDEPISGLPAGVAVSGSDLMALVQSGVTVKSTITALLAFLVPTDTEDTQTVTGSTMALSHSPIFTYGVFLNGQRLTKTADYSIAGNVVTFSNALSSDIVTVSYKY